MISLFHLFRILEQRFDGWFLPKQRGIEQRLKALEDKLRDLGAR